MKGQAGHEIHQPFVRDRLTWLGYLLVGNFCYTMSTLGPLMPFLRNELHLSYTVAAYHFSAWALGTLTAGLLGDNVIGFLGKRRAIWVCGTVLTVATGAFIAAGHAWMTIAAAWACGGCGSIMGQSISTTYADRFGSQRAIAFVEQNICASLYCALAPVAVGYFARIGVGWRMALVFPIVHFAILYAIFRKTEVITPAAQHQTVGWRTQLPLAYWAYWTVMLLMVACEWSLIYWSAEFLRSVANLTKAMASQAVSAFLIGMLLGRIVGSRLARSVRIAVLLPSSSALAITGFLIFWLSHNAVLNVAGLFVTGLGIANFYPLTLAAAIGAAADRSAVATVRFSLGSGSAILLVPLLLGMVADRSGIFTAYGIVGCLLVVAAAIVFVANFLGARHENRSITVEMEAESPGL